MLYYLKLYGIALLVFLALDAVWLGVIARAFYVRHLGYVLAPQPQWWAACVFYVLFIAGALVLVIIPALDGHTVGWLLARALLFGLVTYATYDLTNLATIKDWPWVVTVVDLIWGTLVSTLVCTAAFFAGKWLV